MSFRSTEEKYVIFITANSSLEGAGGLRFSFALLSQLDNAIITKLLFQEDQHTQLFQSMKLAYTECERDGHGEGEILHRQVVMGVIARSVLLSTVFI